MADKTYRGVTMTPIFQFAQNNGLDEKDFFDFIKSKWGEEGTKGMTLESDVPHGTLEKFFDEYADKKFKERPKRDIFTDKDKEYLDHEVVNDKNIDAIKDNFTPPGAKSQKEELKDEIDTNDNGEIEVDEMADFQKSLDDYASKNKKGRDDIPVTTRR